MLKWGFGGKERERETVYKQCNLVGELLCFPLAVVLDVCGWGRTCLFLLLDLPVKLEPCV